MARVIFYTKLGCITSGKQQGMLRLAGHELEIRDILAANWTAAELRGYFGKRPVAQWFNPNSPRVKSGEVKPESYGEEEALRMMVADPLLIRRPLLQVGSRREVGFEEEMIHDWIGLAAAGEAEFSRGTDLQQCSNPAQGRKDDYRPCG